MKALQNRAFHWLAVLMFIGFCAAGLISWQRFEVEHNAKQVEMVYDYYNVIDSAVEEGKSADELFSLYKKSGITSLAIYDETPEKLINHNFIRVYRG